MPAPTKAIVQRVERLMRKQSREWIEAERGYTTAGRWVVQFDNGTSAFVKAGITGLAAEWLRLEQSIYANLKADYLPSMLEWSDDDHVPIIMLEDLSDGYWPPPWDKSHIDTLLGTLAKVRSTPIPPGVQPLNRTELRGWTLVQEDPAPFLSLGLCSTEWLRDALPTLIRAEENAPLEGEEFVHADVHSDNVCFAENRLLLIDWDEMGIANGLFDVAFWLPSLESEGGPRPEEVCPQASVFSGFISGFFAARAGLPAPQTAPFARRVQLEQLQTALPWAIRTYGLQAMI